jgi:uncharacterized protein YutE (UPF0331/DUF86 family)
MVNKDKLTFLFSELEKYLSELEHLKTLSQNEFFKDSRNIYTVRYLFQVSIETCINIGTHLISSYRLGLPKEYAEVFRILKNNNILSEAVENKLILMVRFRNRLVHLYWDIDDEMIFEYLQEHLNDFQLFRKEVTSFLSKQ